jgi:hypothetical protein
MCWGSRSVLPIKIGQWATGLKPVLTPPGESVIFRDAIGVNVRVLAGILLLVSAVLYLLLGGGFVLSSKYQQFKAQMDAGDLSSVSKDLDVSDAELNKMHKVAQANAGSGHLRPLVVGIVLLALTLLQIVAGIVLLVRRARSLSLVTCGLAVAALVTTMLLEGFVTLEAIAGGAVVLAAVFVLLAKPVAARHDASV